MAAYERNVVMRARRSAVIWWTALVALSVAVAYGIVYVRGVATDRAKDQQRIEMLSQQVRNLGGTPVVGPKGDPGTAGQKGADGLPGRDGSDGSDGRDGSNGEDGDPGPVGPTGAEGEPGAEGAPGKDGATGPTGPAGPEGPQGDVGPTGPQGEQGPKGEQGDVGESIMCPDGYTPTEVTWFGDEYIICKEV